MAAGRVFDSPFWDKPFPINFAQRPLTFVAGHLFAPRRSDLRTGNSGHTDRIVPSADKEPSRLTRLGHGLPDLETQLVHLTRVKKHNDVPKIVCILPLEPGWTIFGFFREITGFLIIRLPVPAMLRGLWLILPDSHSIELVGIKGPGVPLPL